MKDKRPPIQTINSSYMILLKQVKKDIIIVIILWKAKIQWNQSLIDKSKIINKSMMSYKITSNTKKDT
jgi:hypothetical protein